VEAEILHQFFYLTTITKPIIAMQESVPVSIDQIITVMASIAGTALGYKKLKTVFSSEDKKVTTNETESHLISTLSKLIDDMDSRQSQLSASLDKSLEELHELRGKLSEFKEMISNLRSENAQLKTYLLSKHGENWDQITERRGSTE